MKELLTDLLEYMEQRADADIEGPNKEMGFQIRIEEALVILAMEGTKLNDDLVFFTIASISKSEPDLPAPNTVMWWLCRIADPEIRRKAVENWDGTNDSHNEFVAALYNAFTWSETKYGSMWAHIYTDGTPLLPEPEWKEYLEIRK